jgi:hypothetical protein
MGLKSKNSPDDVFVLIRLYNVRTDPELVLFVDPWQLHEDGLLELTTESQYETRFTQLPPSIRLDESARVKPSRKIAVVEGHGRVSHGSEATKNQLEMNLADPVYLYKPLGFGEIRLLELLRGTGEMPIEGFVYHTSLELAGRYSALSRLGKCPKTFQPPK